jgi:Flp pilus assembly protein TadB
MEEARSTKDLLEAEQQLTQREAEIESIKGRMQYLEQSALLSSIWIDLQPSILSQPVAEQWRPAETVRRAVEALVDGLRGFGNFLIFFAIAILPWLLAIALVIFLIVRLVRWRTRARRARQATGNPTPGADADPR